ncbi:MAG TPA: hypothetical protein VF192_01445 [Longimicrobiales bacterium]
MAVAVRLSCEYPDCDAAVHVEVDIGAFDSSMMTSENADNGEFLLETSWLMVPDGWAVSPLIACEEHRAEKPPHSCEAELRGRRDYSPSLCRPIVFACSCGKVYACRVEEAEGVDWVEADLTEHPLHPRGCQHRDLGEFEGAPPSAECGAPAVLTSRSPDGTETWLCERGHRVAVGK